MVDYSRYTVIKVEKKGKVGLVTLNRPEALNSFDNALHRELEDMWEDLADDDDINAAVITGAGRAFSAGGDLKNMRQKAIDGTGTPMRGAYRMINNLLSLDKPIIAAVNGHAIGLGASVALHCDVIFASNQAKFADPHVNVGLVAGDGGCIIWPILIGVARAKQYLMTGDMIEAVEAERIGLINKALPPDEVLPAAMALAERLANGPIKAIQWTKMSVNQYIKSVMNTTFPVSLATEFMSMKTDDYIEALDSFIEKRPPNYKGR